jgi:hypothetical protein
VQWPTLCDWIITEISRGRYGEFYYCQRKDVIYPMFYGKWVKLGPNTSGIRRRCVKNAQVNWTFSNFQFLWCVWSDHICGFFLDARCNWGSYSQSEQLPGLHGSYHCLHEQLLHSSKCAESSSDLVWIHMGLSENAR